MPPEMGCQKKSAEKIIDGGGDYIFSLKGNHGALHEEVKLFMDDAIAERCTWPEPYRSESSYIFRRALIMAKTNRTKNALKILHKRYIGKNKQRLESLQKERENLSIAEDIYNLRTENNLSQKQLAELIGTTQSVISRLEVADYNGHSLVILRKIALVFHKKVQIQFVPDKQKHAYV